MKTKLKVEHCSDCDVCVMNVDHHCGVFDRCIAQNNIKCFYIFLLTFFGTLVFLLIAFITSADASSYKL